MAPEDHQRILDRLESGRRDFLKKLMLTAYAAPFVASFGMKEFGLGEAVAQSNLCANMTIPAGFADLIIFKSASPNPAVPGQNLTYFIRVQNCGFAAGTNVTVSDVVPVGTTFVSFLQSSGPSFTISPLPPVGGTGVVTATIASFADGAVATFQLVVNVTP